MSFHNATVRLTFLYYSLLAGQEKERKIFYCFKQKVSVFELENIFKINAANFGFLCPCLIGRKESEFCLAL